MNNVTKINFNNDKTKIIIEIPCKGEVIEYDIKHTTAYSGIDAHGEIKSTLITIIESELEEFLNSLEVKE